MFIRKHYIVQFDEMMKENNRNLIILAAGTGGHVYPGLSIAKKLILKDVNVSWIGTKSGMEKNIIKDNNIKGIIIGNPLNMDGSSGSSAQSAKDMSDNISRSIDLPICLWDERLSTVGAFNLSSQLDVNVSKREKKIDENAAAFILQGAIDFLNN